MVSATYNGEPCNLGRFGLVKKGQKLDLTEDEAKYLEGHPNKDIEIKDEKKEKKDSKGGSGN